MKKIILISLTALAVIACQQKKSGNEQSELWQQNIVGEWFYESVSGDSVSNRYQIFLQLKASGQVIEREHYILPAQDGKPAVDRDGNIFTGTWKIQNDTLVKKGVMKVISEEGLYSKEEPERKEGEVTGYTKLVNVTKDSIITLDRAGSTVVFVRH